MVMKNDINLSKTVIFGGISDCSKFQQLWHINMKKVGCEKEKFNFSLAFVSNQTPPTLSKSQKLLLRTDFIFKENIFM